MITLRGEVRNRRAAEQGRSMSGLTYKWKITPSDTDGVLIEFKNRLFIFLEAKYKGAPFSSYGTRTAFLRLVDVVALAGKLSLGIVFDHEDIPPKPIDYARGFVREYRFRGRWYSQDKIVKRYGKIPTVKEVIDSFLAKYFPDCLL